MISQDSYRNNFFLFFTAPNISVKDNNPLFTHVRIVETIWTKINRDKAEEEVEEKEDRGT